MLENRELTDDQAHEIWYVLRQAAQANPNCNFLDLAKDLKAACLSLFPAQSPEDIKTLIECELIKPQCSQTSITAGTVPENSVSDRKARDMKSTNSPNAILEPLHIGQRKEDNFPCNRMVTSSIDGNLGGIILMTPEQKAELRKYGLKPPIKMQ